MEQGPFALINPAQLTNIKKLVKIYITTSFYKQETFHA